MKNILIAGAGSYIGESFREYMKKYPEEYSFTVISTRNLKPKPELFAGFDCVLCVAGIAHRKETKSNRHLYYEVNRDLVICIAEIAKKAGVGQFILLSTMAVYGLETGYITKKSAANPTTAYGESKLQADEAIRKLEDESFIFTCLRPPMVYGKNCKGNYQKLRTVALKMPLFPEYENQRSMIYIGNLCEFIKECIDKKRGGLFFPQNSEYVNTTRMVKQIAAAHGKRIGTTKVFNWIIRMVPISVINKVFGNLVYEAVDMVGHYTLDNSIKDTELNTNRA